MQKATRFFLASFSVGLIASFYSSHACAVPVHSATTSTAPTKPTATASNSPAHNLAPPDPAKIVYVLRQGKTIRPDQPLNVFVSQRQATVLTERRSAENDKDVKIDAVLISHDVIEGFPDQITKVRLLFQRPGTSTADQIDVTTGDVKAFGVGAINVEALLNSLDLTPIDLNSVSHGSSSVLHVVDGPQLDKRLLLLSRIEALKSKGTSVKPFMDLFDNIEKEAPKGSEEQLSSDISFLSDKLSEQETLVKESHLPATHNVPGIYSGGAQGNAVPNGLSGFNNLMQWSGRSAIKRLHNKFERMHNNQGVDVSAYTAKLADAERLLSTNDPNQRNDAFNIIHELERVQR